jgi:hypothetical protein
VAALLPAVDPLLQRRHLVRQRALLPRHGAHTTRLSGGVVAASGAVAPAAAAGMVGWLPGCTAACGAGYSLSIHLVTAAKCG